MKLDRCSHLALMLLCPVACAAIRFEQTEIRLHPAIEDEEARAVFIGRNDGMDEVNIVGVKAQCGCTVAAISSHKVAPGDILKVTAVFRFGGRMGEQRKVVTIQTDDGNPDQDLVLLADIPRLLTYATRVARWSLGGDAEPTELRINAPQGRQISGAKATSDDDTFIVEASISNDSQELVIRITPLSTAAPAMGTIRTTVDLGREVDLNLYAIIK